MGLPDRLNGVGRKHPVGRKNWKIFRYTLGNKEPIERIFMVIWEIFDHSNMLDCEVK